MTPLRVLIVAEDPLARAGVATLLADLPDLAIAGRISGADDLTDAVQTHRPDVALWDMGWKPDAALSRLAEKPGDLPVVALVNDETDAAAAWRAGAQGVLPRDAKPTRIAAALLAAAEGLTVIDPAFRSALARRETTADPSRLGGGDEPPVEELTPRELEVLRLLAEGLPNKTIAQRLDISEHTVKFHVNALLGKLGVGSRTEAVVRATRLGLVFL